MFRIRSRWAARSSLDSSGRSWPLAGNRIAQTRITATSPAIHLLTLAAFASAADYITIERVIGPEILARYKHPASFTELASGDLYLAYYGGSGEYATDTAVYGARLPKGSKQWTRPIVIADTPF